MVYVRIGLQAFEYIQDWKDTGSVLGYVYREHTDDHRDIIAAGHENARLDHVKLRDAMIDADQYMYLTKSKNWLYSSVILALRSIKTRSIPVYLDIDMDMLVQVKLDTSSNLAKYEHTLYSFNRQTADQ